MEDEEEEDAGKEDEEGMDKMGAFRKWLEVRVFEYVVE